MGLSVVARKCTGTGDVAAAFINWHTEVWGVGDEGAADVSPVAASNPIQRDRLIICVQQPYQACFAGAVLFKH